jgi:hypothetical protein
MDDMELRMRRVEEAVIKINHFTETFPELMDAKFKANSDKIDVNRRLLYGIVTAIVGGAIALVWSLV